MAKIKQEKEIIQKFSDENIEKIMGDRFGRYSKYIIQERALPDARDGLKPVQRRIIYAMNKDGNTNEKPYRKSAKTVGLVIGNYHPHGDTSVYDAMIRMSQWWKNNIPLIDVHGNNGSIDGDSQAAMRYTEARLSKISNLFTMDLPYETVEMTPTFDDSSLEPSVLPSRLPALLVNGATGIAAGYATNIPPFNASEIINGVLYKLKTPQPEESQLFQIIKGPDFPTGGIIQGISDIKKAMKTGQGKIVLRANSKIVKGKTSDEIIITEIPYEVIKQDLVTQIEGIRIDKKLDSLISVRDESDRKGLRIVIEVKSGSNIKEIMKYLYKNTNLQVNVSFNMVSIINKTPKLTGVNELLDVFIDARDEVIKKRSLYLFEKNTKRIHIIEGLIKAISLMDEIVATIKASKNKSDVIENLIKKFSFTKAQAEAIAEMKLYRLCNTDVVELQKELKKLTAENKKLEKAIKSENERRKILISECEEILELLPKERKTKIEDEIQDLTTNEEALIKEEQVVLTVSKDGYIKRVSMRGYKSNNGDTGLKEGDSIIYSGEVNNLSNALILTSDGRYLRIPIYKIEEGKWKDVGVHIGTYAKVEGSIEVVKCYIDNKDLDKKFILSITDNGMIKKTSIKDLQVVGRFSKMASFMKMKDNGTIVFMEVCNGDEDIFFISKNGYANYFAIKTVAVTNPNTVGFVSSNLAEGDSISDGYIGAAKVISLETDKGCKKLDLKELKKTRRGNKGVNVFEGRKSSISVLAIKE